jgi:hypothetical protein
MFITRKSIVAPLPAQAEQKIGVGGDRCLRLRFRLDQRIAHAVLERVARAVSRGRVFDVGMRLHHRAAGAREPIGFARGNGIFRAETTRPKRPWRFKDAGAETKSR